MKVPAAVEEFLRYDSPVNLATMRYTTEPVRVGEPERLDVSRETAGHLAFGHGIHYCVGAPLARMEAAIAFTRLLERFPRLRLAPSVEPLEYVASSRTRGLVRLPVLLRA